MVTGRRAYHFTEDVWKGDSVTEEDNVERAGYSIVAYELAGRVSVVAAEVWLALVAHRIRRLLPFKLMGIIKNPKVTTFLHVVRFN